MNARLCRECGASFTPEPKRGRPPARCPACRGEAPRPAERYRRGDVVPGWGEVTGRADGDGSTTLEFTRETEHGTVIQRPTFRGGERVEPPSDLVDEYAQACIVVEQALAELESAEHGGDERRLREAWTRYARAAGYRGGLSVRMRG